MVQDAREMHGPARSVRSVPGLEVSRESTEPRREDHRSVIASQICWTLHRSSQVPRSSAKIRDNRASTVSPYFFFDFDCDISEMRLRFSRFLADCMHHAWSCEKGLLYVHMWLTIVFERLSWKTVTYTSYVSYKTYWNFINIVMNRYRYDCIGNIKKKKTIWECTRIEVTRYLLQTYF